VRRILDSMAITPAYVRNARLDILAANQLGAALFAPILTRPAQPANNARFLFLDPAAPEFYPGWERHAQDVVAMLRTEAGRTLTFEAFDLAADSGLRISAYTAEPGTPSADALKVLASWAASPDRAAAADSD
jgi:transcription regulator MmyB-like protein